MKKNKIKKELEKWKNFVIFSLVLAIFFVLEYFHKWANEFFIKLHFCNHTFCIVFAIIFFGFAFFAWQKKKSYINIALIILVIGILFMNFTYCDVDGKMYLIDMGMFFSSLQEQNITKVCCEHDCSVPIPPCLETDSGRDYLSYGLVMSGVDIGDLCLADGNLRERYCNSDLTYTSEDIDCAVKYGDTWICEEGECRDSGEIVDVEEIVDGNESDCGDGIDNDGDLLIDCADPDCDYAWLEGGCGDFDYSCEHNPTTPYPSCGGTCPPGSVCGVYNTGDGTLDGGWCECIPEGETSCYESDDCTGWCDEGYEYICVGDNDGCYCEWIYDLDTCFDSDGGIEPTVGGVVVYTPFMNLDQCEFKFDNWLTEYSCGEDRIVINPIDCNSLSLCCIDDEVNGAYCGECPPLEL